MFGKKDHLTVERGRLHISGADTVALAQEFGTPLYVTSEERLRQNFRAYDAFSSADKYFAVKANGNLALLRILAQEGAGADVFSAGELYLATLAGIPREKILFNGNSKRESELVMAAASGVRVSVDSPEELETLARAAHSLDRTVEVLFRVNPDINVQTHPKIATGLRTSKFGIPHSQVVDVYRQAMASSHILPVGLHCHIGSQILDVSSFVEAAGRMMDLAAAVTSADGSVEMIDLGGGLGIQYDPQAQPAPSPADLAAGVLPVIRQRSAQIGISPRLVLEPGRSIVADSTILLTRVNTVKDAHVTFVGLDAGFNVLARPMLYDSYHHIVACDRADQPAAGSYTVVGPICESGDVLARDRLLPPVQRGDVLAFLDAGAYGFSMSSQYNGQGRPAEVLVAKDGGAELIRRAEGPSDLMAGQMIPSRLLY
ncbi:MAG: Diaminopimelate decarboxylase [Methanosaeta sp. PtaU1.Bin028]|nr:MAG: Diaminopimelate decarboxylase [Methanosaeta sp. PtaU1.Bin028]